MPNDPVVVLARVRVEEGHGPVCEEGRKDVFEGYLRAGEGLPCGKFFSRLEYGDMISKEGRAVCAAWSVRWQFEVTDDALYRCQMEAGKGVRKARCLGDVTMWWWCCSRV